MLTMSLMIDGDDDDDMVMHDMMHDIMIIVKVIMMLSNVKVMSTVKRQEMERSCR